MTVTTKSDQFFRSNLLQCHVHHSAQNYCNPTAFVTRVSSKLPCAERNRQLARTDSRGNLQHGGNLGKSAESTQGKSAREIWEIWKRLKGNLGKSAGNLENVPREIWREIWGNLQPTQGPWGFWRLIDDSGVLSCCCSGSRGQDRDQLVSSKNLPFWIPNI